MKLARPIEEIPCSEMNIQKGDEVSDWRAQNKTRIMPTKTFGKRMKEQKERGTRIAHNHTRTHTHTQRKPHVVQIWSNGQTTKTLFIKPRPDDV